MTDTNLDLKLTVNMVPCYDCICVPVCRHKTFRNIYFDCALIQNMFGNKDDQSGISEYKYLWLEEALKPTIWYVKWELTKKGEFTASVEPRQ